MDSSNTQQAELRVIDYIAMMSWLFVVLTALVSITVSVSRGVAPLPALVHGDAEPGIAWVAFGLPGVVVAALATALAVATLPGRPLAGQPPSRCS